MVCFTVEGSISLEKETNDDKLCPRLLSHETLLFLHNEEAKEKSLSPFLHELFKPPLLLLIKTGKTALKRKDLIVTLVNIIYLFITQFNYTDDQRIIIIIIIIIIIGHQQK